MHDEAEDEENKDFKLMLEKEMMQPMSQKQAENDFL